MKPMSIKLYILVQCAILTTAFSAGASTISLEPSAAQRVPGGLVRVNIFVENAVDLISMGVKVSFDPAVVQAETASKYEDVAGGWLMDDDGDPATTGDQYANPLSTSRQGLVELCLRRGSFTTQRRQQT